jgi:hypothetical protein
VCRVAAEDLITHRPEDPHFSDLKKIDAILADIRNRPGQPEPKAKLLEPEMKTILDELEKSWNAQPHKQRDRER